VVSPHILRKRNAVTQEDQPYELTATAVALCSPVKVCQRFGGTYCLSLQGEGVGQWFPNCGERSPERVWTTWLGARLAGWGRDWLVGGATGWLGARLVGWGRDWLVGGATGWLGKRHTVKNGGAVKSLLTCRGAIR
jgi:hypothetical protein